MLPTSTTISRRPHLLPSPSHSRHYRCESAHKRRYSAPPFHLVFASFSPLSLFESSIIDDLPPSSARHRHVSPQWQLKHLPRVLFIALCRALSRFLAVSCALNHVLSHSLSPFVPYESPSPHRYFASGALALSISFRVVYRPAILGVKLDVSSDRFDVYPKRGDSSYAIPVPPNLGEHFPALRFAPLT